MSKFKATMLVLALGFVCVSNAMAKTDGRKAAGQAAVRACRFAVGAYIGGEVGKRIIGGPIGAAAGTFLSPSQTGCYTGERCARGATVIDPRSGNRSVAR